MSPPERSLLHALSGTLAAGLGPSIARHWPTAAALAGSLVVVDAGFRLVHGSLSSVVGLSALLAGGWWLWRREPPSTRGSERLDVGGWLERLQGLEEDFQSLCGEADDSSAQAARRDAELKQVRAQLERAGLELALVGRALPPTGLQPSLATALTSRWPLRLHWGQPLPGWEPERDWPRLFEGCDLLLYHLVWPLSAADLRWLQAIPEGLPAWLLVQVQPPVDGAAVCQELAALLSGGPSRQTLLWSGQGSGLAEALAPLVECLDSQGRDLRDGARVRTLRALHGRRQAELETLRRQAFQHLQQRTQWLVAAGVMASPVLSLDLLVLAVANGLMLREMARLWNCPWSADQLRGAASELARAALAFGVVDWSTQTLATLARLHGVTSLAGTAVQALSAAYLTRVVGRAMADLLARSVGVSALDLERLKREAPLVVASAAEAEKLDWGAFLQQGRNWLATSAPQSPQALG